MIDGKFNPLMLVTPEFADEEILKLVAGFLAGGGKWVQLRLKDLPEIQLTELARRVSEKCKDAGAVFIVNDYPLVAREVGADGVHLGQNDMPIATARAILGDDFIIGGTANTLAQMVNIANEGGNYIGLGPFRYTTTKKNLAPVVGLEGYRSIIDSFRQLGHELPITAIGGIQKADVRGIMGTGVNGIAISGFIANHPDVQRATKEIIQELASGLL